MGTTYRLQFYRNSCQVKKESEHLQSQHIVPLVLAMTSEEIKSAYELAIDNTNNFMI